MDKIRGEPKDTPLIGVKIVIRLLVDEVDFGFGTFVRRHAHA